MDLHLPSSTQRMTHKTPYVTGEGKREDVGEREREVERGKQEKRGREGGIDGEVGSEGERK